MAQEKINEIRIYVACLAAYNNGILHGAWIDAEQNAEAIRDGINAMLSASPIAGAEEYAIHDYEGFGGIRLSEWEGIEQVVEYAEFIAVHGELGAKLIEHFGNLENTRTAIEEHYVGVYPSVASFAEEITAETTEIPENLGFYIDYERMGRDMEINDLIVVEVGFEELHLFWTW